MNKKSKLIIGLILTVILSVSIPLGLNILKNKKNSKEIDIETVKNELNKTMQEQINVEKDKMKEEYDKQLNKETLDKMLIKLGGSIEVYYKDNSSNIGITHSIDEQKHILVFNNEENTFVEDNKNNEKNSYNINHEIDIIDNGSKYNQVLTISIKRESKEKFDIKNCELLEKYLEILIDKDLTDDDKKAINIKVNMDLSEVKTIEGLEDYIYNDTSLKIEDLIIKTEHNTDDNSIKFTININEGKNRFFEDDKEES